jgi:nickel-dependent lactate racemase
MKIGFPYSAMPPLEVADSSLIAVLEPRVRPERTARGADVIGEALKNPIGASPIREMAKGKNSILILVDDYTRTTPVHLILPPVLAEIHSSGVAKNKVRILIASGTHRPMTLGEKRKRFGPDLMSEYALLDHCHDDPSQLVQLPTTEHGTEVWVNKAVTESDFVLGIGHIVPHRVAGFSGGGKIVQPGVCGSVTTGQTHWLSARFEGARIMGMIENPVRREIDDAARAAGLTYIVNAILDGTGKLSTLVCGHPVEAFRAGARAALEIFGVPMSEPADIVIADSFPADVELWQAAKGVYAADLALKVGGVLILVTPCPEGVSAEFPEISSIGYRPFRDVEDMIRSGEIKDLTLAAHLVHVGRVIREKATGILVSPGIDAATAKRLGFHPALTPQDALDLALEMKGKGATIAVLRNGGEIMPIPSSAPHA